MQKESAKLIGTPYEGSLSMDKQLIKKVEAFTPVPQPAFSQIPPSDLSVTVRSTAANGGGTGQEFPKNLLIPGNSGGNKWYDPYSGETWIRVQVESPKIVVMYGLKSANDCPERDPSSINFYGITGDQEMIRLHSVSNLSFKERFQWKLFTVQNCQLFSEYMIEITQNRSLAQGEGWGSGTQLAEIELFQGING